MKIKFWLIPMLLLGGGVMLTGCGRDEEPPLPPGSFKDSTNYDAPKAIESTEIVAFHCGFSMINVVIPGSDSELLGNAYTLTAEWKDGAVAGSYGRRFRYSDEESQSFQAGQEFLDQLQELAVKHDLPRYNGLSREVSGLPGDYGASLSIKYASGETVYASDNQGCFLPLEAIEDLEQLFRQQAEAEGAPADP